MGLPNGRTRPSPKAALADIDADGRPVDRGARASCRQDRRQGDEDELIALGTSTSPAARVDAGANRDVVGRQADLRRGIARAVRRRGAVHPDTHFQTTLDELEQHCCQGGARSSIATTRCARDFLIPSAALVARVRAWPSPNAARGRCPRRAPAGGELHRRVRHEQVVERLQLVSGRLPSLIQVNTDLPDLHRSRGRSRVPRGLSRTSRLQRAAREAPGARPRLGRVLRLPALLAAVAHCRRHRQLRHRGGVSGRASGWPSSATCCFPLAGLNPARVGRVLRGSEARGRLSYAGQRGGPPVSERRDRPQARPRNG